MHKSLMAFLVWFLLFRYFVLGIIGKPEFSFKYMVDLAREEKLDLEGYHYSDI